MNKQRITLTIFALALAIFATFALTQNTTYAAQTPVQQTEQIATQQEGTTPCDGLDLESTPAELLACITYQAGLIDKYLDEKLGGEDNAYDGTNQGTCPDADHHMDKDAVYEASAYCITKGDVQVALSADGPWTTLYDGTTGTGVLLVCEKNCFVKAPFGANVSNRTLPDLLQEMLESGCDLVGCTSVYIYHFPSGQSETRTTAYPAATATETVTASDVVSQTVTVTPPTMTPTAPEPTATPRPIKTVALSECNVSIPRGSWMLVPAGCVVSGDIAVSDAAGGLKTALYDSDERTGLVTVITKATWVFAPYGASVTDADPADVVETLDLVGCGLPEGCERVTLTEWPLPQ